MTATPWGFRDILPEEAQVREQIADAVKGCLRARGYLPVETPLLEDRRALEDGARPLETPFKLFDDDGRLLVVRSDNTLPIVRMVSSRMDAGSLPLRLRYEAPVVREQPRYAGSSRQFTQLGFELIGQGGTAGDVEIVSTAIEAVRALSLSDCRIVCGSVRPYQALLARCDGALAREALQLVHANDFVDLDDLVAASAEPAAVKRAICELPRVHGGLEALDRVDELLQAAGVEEAATAELRALYTGLAGEGAGAGQGADFGAGLSADGDAGPGAAAGSSACGGGPAAAGLSAHLGFDFSLMNSFDYYTGLVFKVYAGGLPDPVGSGGRYDAVFDGVISGAAHVPAAGFAFSLERLEGACEANRAEAAGAVPASVSAVAGGDYAVGRASEGPLRIAVPKGSLKEGSIAALEAVGLDVDGLRDPGRHLIIRSHDMREGAGAGGAGCGAAEARGIGEVEFIIVRATDAPAFVACGGADCGICGRDSLIEADLRLLQLVDLRFGECRFIEAEPAWRAGEAERAYARRGSLRVATKYPKIAAAWYAGRGVNADIVQLHGNIELGPIVGMTDRIVDITATGSTLRDNDLVITGELFECTARFFVNPGRARLDWRVRELADRLAAYVK